jgi:putative ATP-binding cassette transporter
MAELIRLVTYLVGVVGGRRRSRLHFAGVIVAGVASGLALAGLIATINALLARGAVRSTTLTAAFLGLLLLRPALRFLAQFLVVRLTEQGFVTLRMDLCRRILDTPLRRLEDLGRARLTAGLTSDVGQIVSAMVLLPTLVMHAAVVLGFLVYLGWLSLPLLPPLFVITALGALVLRWTLARAVARIGAGRQLYDKLFHQFRAVTEGAKELQLHRSRRGAFMQQMETTARAHRREMRTGDLYLGATSASSELLFFTAVAVMLLAVPRFWTVDPATLASYVIAILMLRAPLEGVVEGFSVLMQASVSVRKVEELVGALGAILAEPAGGVPRLAPGGWRSLELAGVTHAYQGDADERFTLGPVNLSFRPGELVFVVGGNGSGKTTLAKVILGLYAPEAGEIRVDGRPVAKADQDQYRQHFSAIFSDFFLFDSVLGLESPDLDGDARRYLSALHLQHKVTVSGGVLSTTDLSQGQRKRLALMGAYLEDRPIYLFDEWAADQDPQFKEVFYRRLLPELKARGKTLIVISHDDQYYASADRVVRLDYGQVTFDGPACDYMEGPHAPALLAARQPAAAAVPV